MQNRYDLVIYGATGFTGSVATKRLMESDLTNMRVAIAGRNQQKLEELQQSCKFKPDIIIADSTNLASVEAMVQNTKAVLNFAGPFAKYAEPVISACAKWGTQLLLKKCKHPNIKFKRILNVNSIEVIASLTANDCGIGLLPSCFTKTLYANKLQRLPNVPVIKEDVYLIYRKEYLNIAAFKTVIEFIKEWAKNNAIHYQ